MDTSRGTVLVVEDDRATRDMVVTLISEAGYRAVSAEDGLEALHLLRAVRHREPAVPCLILLDLSMPRLGGREFRRAQLADPIVATVPVVVMTGAIDAEATAASLGAVATMAKPLDLTQLVDTVRRSCVWISDAGDQRPSQRVGKQSTEPSRA